jgi:hypothetical protein
MNPFRHIPQFAASPLPMLLLGIAGGIPLAWWLTDDLALTLSLATPLGILCGAAASHAVHLLTLRPGRGMDPDD